MTEPKQVKTKPVKNTSPLRYPGGKTRAISILEEYLVQYYPNKKILLSPFFGGGSFELSLTTKGYTVYGNDLFVPLYTFWKTQQAECDLLIQKIREKMPVSKEVFKQLRQTIITTEEHKASAYFIINRCSFSGATLSGGFSQEAAEKRLTESSLQRLKACDTSNITFTNLDCNVFLEKNPQTADTVVYADPPYYIDKYIYGKDGDMHENFDHVSFAKKILTRTDWLISYNDCDYIRALYKDCRIFNVKWSYGMNASKASSEIIILPPLAAAQ
jgi:DNA adenine methylase